MNTVPAAEPLLTSELDDIELIHRGKVRDVYAVGDHLLLVATDRISAFDVVLPGGVPSKGAVLTQLSCFWFKRLQHIVSNHLISAEVDKFPESLQPYADQLAGRSMYARHANRFDVECVVRGYLIGSGWRDYQRTGQVCGIELPPGLQQAERLPEPIFTPSTKADSGHDENVSVAQMAELIGPEWTDRLAEVSLQLYSEAAEYAESRGIIIADTKFEFGLVDDERLILIDEALTPDSSRFWPAAEYRRGVSPPSYDKEFVREYLSHLDWDKSYPGPVLPDEIVQKTSAKYHEAYEVLTGAPLPEFP